jgi:hypothetical protein
LLDEIEAKVTAGFDPFIVLLGQHGADEPDQRGAVREDPDHVGAARLLKECGAVLVSDPVELSELEDAGAEARAPLLEGASGT